MHLRGGLISVTLWLSACAGPTYHSATPIAEGTTQFGVGFGVRGHAGPDSQRVEPIPEIIVRRGISENVDIGAKAGGPITLDLNWAFINNDSFALSFNPTFVVGFAVFGGTLGLLADVIKGPDFTLTLGLKPGVFLLNDKRSTDGTYDPAGYYAVGISGMVAAHVDVAPLILAPSIQVIAPFVETENLNFLAGIGILF